LPITAKASFFSDLFNTDSASANITPESSSETNSQNIGLLQANVSSAEVIQDKKDKNDKDKSVVVSNTTGIVSDNALVSSAGPIGVSDGTENVDISPDQMSVYVVRENDSITKIAEMFDVSANTIRWANDIKVGEKLKEGDVLIILPVSGVQVTVAKGQTLKSIAQKYKVDITDIASFNGISEDAKLAVGDELIVPDGEISETTPKVAPAKTSTGSYVKTPTVYASGYFINPVPGFKYRSQGSHAHGTAIDLAAATGTPILASASGRVSFARNGYNGGFGNLVIIEHPNGTQTYYAHQSKIYVHVGEKASQGQIIGLVGNTGHSTGPHLHFEVRGAKNPGTTTPMSWASL